jgi:hypothetical protein
MNGARGAMVAPPLLRNSDHAARASRRPNGTLTYNARDKHLEGVTYGGYSDSVVVDERFVLRVPSNLADTRAGSEGPVAEIAAMTGTDVATYTRERPGMSAFVLEDGVVYHAYSAYARGLDGLWGMYQTSGTALLRTAHALPRGGASGRADRPSTKPYRGARPAPGSVDRRRGW